MALANAGAVILLEVRADPRARLTAPPDLSAHHSAAREFLESAEPGRSTWTPAGGASFAGRLALDDAASAFPLVVRLRAALRADPAGVPVVVLAGLGRGDELDADRLASEAFRAVASQRGAWTCAITPDESHSRVLSALCRAIDSIERGWTRAQWEAIFHRGRDVTLKRIADDLGITYQSVSKRLVAAQSSLHREILEAASLVFSSGTPLP